MLDIIDMCEEGAFGSVCPRMTEKLRKTQCRSRASEAYRSPGSGRQGWETFLGLPKDKTVCPGWSEEMVHMERSVVEKMEGFSSFLISCRGQNRSKDGSWQSPCIQHDCALWTPPRTETQLHRRGEFTRIPGNKRSHTVESGLKQKLLSIVREEKEVLYLAHQSTWLCGPNVASYLFHLRQPHKGKFFPIPGPLPWFKVLTLGFKVLHLMAPPDFLVSFLTLPPDMPPSLPVTASQALCPLTLPWLDLCLVSAWRVSPTS